MSINVQFPADHALTADQLRLAIQTLLGAKPDNRREAWIEEGYGDQTIWYSSEADDDDENHRVRLTELYEGGCVIEVIWGDVDALTPAVRAWAKGDA